MDTLNIIIPRGSTGYSGDSIDSSNLRFAPQLGNVRTFRDVNPNTGVNYSNLDVKCILLRNLTGSALLPGDVVIPSTTVPMQSVTAKCSALSQWFAIVDEYLPAAGVPANDVFWAVIKGPTTAKMVTVSGAQAAGGLPVCTSTTSGKLDFTAATAGSAIIAQNAAGYGYLAATEGAIADAATTARIWINKSYWGQ